MAHIDKFKSANIGVLLSHIDRKDNKKNENRNYSNNIDKTRTHLNYSLINDGLTAFQRYKRRINELKENQPLVKELKPGITEYQVRKAKKRPNYNESDYYDYRLKEFKKDANTLVSFVITTPLNNDGKPILTVEQEKDFFNCCYAYLSHKFGIENIVAAQVHCDETNRHLHYSWIPSKCDKNGVDRLNCCGVLTRDMFQHLHSELQEYINKHLDFYCPILKENSMNKSNLTLNELKIKTELEEQKNQKKQELKNLEIAFNRAYESANQIIKNKSDELKENYNNKLQTIEQDYKNKIIEYEQYYNNKINHYNEKLSNEKERFKDMCFKVNKKENELKNIIENSKDSNIIYEFKTSGTPQKFGKGKIFSKEEIDNLSDKIKLIETKYNYYKSIETDIEKTKSIFESKVNNLNEKINLLKNNIDKLENENIDLLMYKKFTEDKNIILEFNEYKSNKKIIREEVFDYDNKVCDICNCEKFKIIDISEYQENKNKEKHNIKSKDKKGFQLG